MKRTIRPLRPSNANTSHGKTDREAGVGTRIFFESRFLSHRGWKLQTVRIYENNMFALNFGGLSGKVSMVYSGKAHSSKTKLKVVEYLENTQFTLSNFGDSSGKACLVYSGKTCKKWTENNKWRPRRRCHTKHCATERAYERTAKEI